LVGVTVDVNLGRHDGQFMAGSSGEFRMKVEPLVEYRGRGNAGVVDGH